MTIENELKGAEIVIDGDASFPVYENVKMNVETPVLEETVEDMDDDGTEVPPKEEEKPMNIFAREALLNSQKEYTAEEDKLYTGIATMSDEELKAAVAEETTDIKAGDGSASTIYDQKPESKNINSLMIDSLDEKDLITLYNVAVKAKADPNMNVAAALPPAIYEVIRENCKALNIRQNSVINRYARMVVTELVQEMSLDKECKAFQDELSKAMAFPEIVDMYAEHTRELMEVQLLEQAAATEDEVTKAIIIATSKAYTDAYTFKRQLKLLEDDAFIRGLAKKVKRFERACDSFDFVMSKSILKTTALKNVALIDMPHILQLSQDQCKAFIVMLAEVSKNIKPDDKPGIWFMYSSMRNIVSLARTGTTKTDFSTQCIEHLKLLFAVLEKRHTELFSV